MKQVTLFLGVAAVGAAVATFVYSKKGTTQDQQKKMAAYLAGLAIASLGANWVITRP
jgi:fructose-specific phosphotransferase system IIC component